MHHSSTLTEALMGTHTTRATRNNVYLIGPMGSGKTTLGRRAASRLALDFIDCDQEIERQTGASVNLIFDVEGEEGFRTRETELLRDIANRSGLLVATGGGIVTRSINRELMRKSGFIVWLRTPVRHQIDRLSRDRSRPLLETPDREQRLQQLADERNPLYEEIADLVFDSSHRNIARVAARLSDAIRDRWTESGGRVHEAH